MSLPLITLIKLLPGLMFSMHAIESGGIGTMRTQWNLKV